MTDNFETDKWPYVPARWQTKIQGKRAIRGICIHDMEAPEKDKTAENVANYFRNGTVKASAHLCIDSNSIVQCVWDNNIAYAAPGANHDMLHVELAGYAKQTPDDWADPYSTAMLTIAADAVAQYCLKYDIPVKHLSNAELKKGEKGIVGHYQVSEVYKRSSHHDPGKGFPWEFFLERIAGRITARTAVKGDDYQEPILIFVNGKEHYVTGDVISYEQLLEIVYKNRDPSEYKAFGLWTVTYSGPAGNGSLTSGQQIKLEQRMIFNAQITSNT